MKRISLWAMMALLFLISACGKPTTRVYGAPQIKDRLGLIASCTTVQEAEDVAMSTNTTYRVINEKKKLIEFYGLSKEDLIAKLPRAKVSSNKIYQNLITTKNTNGSYKEEIYRPVANPTYRDESTIELFTHLRQIQHSEIIEANGKGVTIAIVDTGVYYNHPHLSPNIKINYSEYEKVSENDDDKNGLIDDSIGWDFYNHDQFPFDDNGHGTHVAGLAAGTLGGVAPMAKILPVKVLSSDGAGDLGTISAGILYAIENGADVINLSLGGEQSGELTSDLQELFDIISIARERNIMIVAAAGNGGDDYIGDCNDELNIYPANIDSSNLLSIAAVNSENELSSYSNYGINSVHIAAPGGDIFTGGLLSTGISNCLEQCNYEDATYLYLTGTSMATPLVSGLIALIKSMNSKLTHEEIRDLILKNGTYQKSLSKYIASGSVINVKKTLEGLSTL